MEETKQVEANELFSNFLTEREKAGKRKGKQPIYTDEERKERKRQSSKKYYEANKAKLAEKRKQKAEEKKKLQELHPELKVQKPKNANKTIKAINKCMIHVIDPKQKNICAFCKNKPKDGDKILQWNLEKNISYDEQEKRNLLIILQEKLIELKASDGIMKKYSNWYFEYKGLLQNIERGVSKMNLNEAPKPVSDLPKGKEKVIEEEEEESEEEDDDEVDDEEN